MCACARDQRGQALIEFALIAPVLLLVLTAILKFGVALENKEELTSSARAGVRQLALGRSSADPCARAYTRVTDSASGLDTSTSKLKVATFYDGSPIGGSTDPPSSTPPTCPGYLLFSGHDVKVMVTYPCDLKVFGRDFGLPSCTLTSRTTERVE